MTRDTLLEAGASTGLRSEVAALTEMDAQARASREAQRELEKAAFRAARAAEQLRDLERMRGHLATRIMGGGMAQVRKP